jgi:hypothetical protein
MPTDLLLIRVHPRPDGWHVAVASEPPRHFRSKYRALQAAELIACQRHLADGSCTAVEVEMPDGDCILWRRFRGRCLAC